MNYVFVLFLIFIAFIGGYFFSRYKFKKFGSRINNNKQYIYQKKDFMSEYERYFYRVLHSLESEYDIKVHPQVNLASILTKYPKTKYINELFRNIDFAIFNKDYSELLLLIEINDSTHNYRNRIVRDEHVNAIVMSANINLIKFHSNYPNNSHYIKNRVINNLGMVNKNNTSI